VGTGISEQTITAIFTLLPKCVVPKLKGKSLKTAEHAIRTHNCTVGKIKRASSRHIEKGHVISQKPAPGRRLRHGAKINLVPSEGRR
jgi:beta-lactam-binding protein with PASTA domain